MYKLNTFLAMSAMALFMSQAFAVKFDNDDPLSEGNKKLAHKLYRGAYVTLEKAPQMVSEEGRHAMTEKSKDFKKWDSTDFKVNQFWAEVKDENMISAEARKSCRDQAFRQEREFDEAWRNNNQVEESVNRAKLDHTHFPDLHDAKYRDVEALKSAAQKLFNAFNSGVGQKEIVEHILAVKLCLSTLGDEAVDDVLNRSDVQ